MCFYKEDLNIAKFNLSVDIVRKVTNKTVIVYGRDYPTKFFAYMLDFLSQ